MNVIRIEAGVYGANCYIIYGNDKEAIIIDPGGDYEEIMAKIYKNNLNIKYIILTHGHGDHIGATEKLREKLEAKVLIHEFDVEIIEDADKNLSNMMGMGKIEFSPDIKLEDKMIIEFSDLKAEIIHSPGHTRGSICIKIEEYLFSGDTLFKGSIGRADLYGGNYEEILESIRNKIMILDEYTVILPGHGENSLLVEEKMTNPYLKKIKFI